MSNKKQSWILGNILTLLGAGQIGVALVLAATGSVSILFSTMHVLLGVATIFGNYLLNRWSSRLLNS